MTTQHAVTQRTVMQRAAVRFGVVAAAVITLLTFTPAAVTASTPQSIPSGVATTSRTAQVTVLTPVVTPWASDSATHTLRIRVSNVKKPVTVTVARANTVAHTFPVVTGTRTLTWAVPETLPAGRWQVRATTGNVTVARANVTVAGRWALLVPPRRVAYPACSSITWAYDTSGEPADVTNMRRDIVTALERLTDVTGLTFTAVKPDRSPTLTFSWRAMGNPGPGGVGGMSYVTSDGVMTAVASRVTLNSESDWVRRPGFGSDSAGVPARGALLLHELGHAFGLGHVRDATQLLHPVAGPGSPTGFAAGDRAGFAWLYQPQRCA